MQVFFQMMINFLSKILDAGERVEESSGECLYIKIMINMNSKNADVQNINYVGGAGSTTAAQFYKDLF